ncbi:MAG: hypothetical protein OXF30_01825 [Candidatus Saccharibacteria bacterium]|nr:hypothetical protein [Candidatus Saccharibacteria bacterium]
MRGFETIINWLGDKIDDIFLIALTILVAEFIKFLMNRRHEKLIRLRFNHYKNWHIDNYFGKKKEELIAQPNNEYSLNPMPIESNPKQVKFDKPNPKEVAKWKHRKDQKLRDLDTEQHRVTAKHRLDHWNALGKSDLFHAILSWIDMRQYKRQIRQSEEELKQKR